MKTALALLLILAAGAAHAANVDEKLRPAEDGPYSYTPPEKAKDGVYIIDIYDEDDRRYARVWNTAPTLDEGRKVGKIETFYPSGFIETRVPLNEADRRDGELVTFDEDGKLTGEQRTFTMNGALKKLATYDHGLLNGPYKELDGDRVIAGGRYVDGESTANGWNRCPIATKR